MPSWDIFRLEFENNITSFFYKKNFYKKIATKTPKPC